MIELAQHIEALLLENDCVIVPGFGGFVAHYAPATHVKEENLFLPPTRTIGFNPQLKLNDGVLVQSYMSAYDTSFADATRIVEKEVSAFIEILHEEGKAHLENVGEIHYKSSLLPALRLLEMPSGKVLYIRYAFLVGLRVGPCTKYGSKW